MAEVAERVPAEKGPRPSQEGPRLGLLAMARRGAVSWRRAAGWVADAELGLIVLAAPLLLFPNRYTPWALGALALPWLCRRLARGYWTARTPLDWPILGLLLMTVVSLYPSMDLSLSWPKFYGIFLGAAVYYALVNGLRDERSLWLTVGLLVLGGVGIAVLGMVGTGWKPGRLFELPQVYSQLPSLAPLMPKSALPQHRLGLHPNEVGGALAMLLPLPCALLLFGPGRWRKVAPGLAVVVMLATLLLTQSRSALMGVGVALFALALWRSRWFLLLAPAGVGALLVVAQRYGVGRLADFLLAMDTATGSGAVAASRLEVWQRALYMIQDFPFTGIGLNTFPFVLDSLYPSSLHGPEARIPHAHNLYLQTAVDLGLPGLVAFLALLGTFGYAAWRAYGLCRRGPRRVLLVGLSLGLVAYLVYGLTDAFTLGAKPGVFMWAMLGLIGAISLRPAEREAVRVGGESP